MAETNRPTEKDIADTFDDIIRSRYMPNAVSGKLTSFKDENGTIVAEFGVCGAIQPTRQDTYTIRAMAGLFSIKYPKDLPDWGRHLAGLMLDKFLPLCDPPNGS